MLEANYPRSLRNQPSQRTTQLLVVIDEAGGPRKIEVVASGGVTALDAAAVRVIEATRFDPPMRQGMRVRSATVLPVTFLPDRSPCASTPTQSAS